MRDERRFQDVKPLRPEKVWALRSDHEAVTEGRTLFPSTVVPPSYSERLLVEGKNSRKIGQCIQKGPWKGLRIFTLTLEERATCPATCKQWTSCYGNAMHLARRLRAGHELQNLLWLEVRDLIKEHGRIAVRLHVLGDFYSPDYVMWWEHMMLRFPGLHLFGFTAWPRRSDIGGRVQGLNDLFPGRCFIRFSGTTGEMGATVIDHVPGEAEDVGAFMCPAQTGKTACCATCALCWSEVKRDQAVGFVLHGPVASRGKRKSKPKPRSSNSPKNKTGRNQHTSNQSKNITLVRSVKTGERFTWNNEEARP